MHPCRRVSFAYEVYYETSREEGTYRIKAHSSKKPKQSKLSGLARPQIQKINPAAAVRKKLKRKPPPRACPDPSPYLILLHSLHQLILQTQIWINNHLNPGPPGAPPQKRRKQNPKPSNIPSRAWRICGSEQAYNTVQLVNIVTIKKVTLTTPFLSVIPSNFLHKKFPVYFGRKSYVDISKGEAIS